MMNKDDAIEFVKKIAPILIDLADSFDHMIIEDWWYVIDPLWELNIWFSEGHHLAAIYPRVDGEIDTQLFFRVQIKEKKSVSQIAPDPEE